VLARLREKKVAGNASLSTSRSIFLSRPRWFLFAAGLKLATSAGRDPLGRDSPGQKITVRVKLHNGSTQPVQLRSLFLEGQVNDSAGKEHVPPLRPGQDYETDFQLELPHEHPSHATRVAPQRSGARRASMPWTRRNTDVAVLPPPPPPLRVSAHYDVPDLRLRIRGSEIKTPTINSPALNFGAGVGGIYR